MKIAIIFGLCILLSLTIVSASNVSWEPATIVDVVGSRVTIETADGNLFVFEAEGFNDKIGSEINVEFDTRGTNDRTDDRIIATKMR